jgi:hypothetical protein
MVMMSKSVLIATPMYGGMCTGEYTRSSLNLPALLNNAGIQASFAYLFNNSIIQMARNTLANIALKNGFTHLMFIDADIKFDAKDVLSLIESDCDIIAGVYPKKRINWEALAEAVKQGVSTEELHKHAAELVVYFGPNQREMQADWNKPAEVEAAGTGFMCIKTEVLAHMVKENGVVEYFDPDHNEKMYEFFRVEYDHATNEVMSEDYWFCVLAKTHGFKVHVAPWVQLGHTGQHLFEGGAIPVKEE